MTSKRYSTARKSLCTRRKHLNVLKFGVPGDAIPPLKFDEDLPRYYFSGMRNVLNEPVALLFNLRENKLYLKFPDSIQKILIRTIEKVFFEPIFGHEDYYIMCLQLDQTRHSRFWIYWVPRQYRKAIEDLINDEFF